jgi:uncharacterized protein YdiU (UPF0061 family)
MQEAIELAEENDDYSGIEKLLENALNPFKNTPNQNQEVATLRPDTRFNLCVSCSS